MTVTQISSRLAPARRDRADSPTAQRPVGTVPSDVPTGAPWTHASCPECGWDGDAAIIRDLDEGLVGWHCPECSTFITTRDLVPDEREDYL